MATRVRQRYYGNWPGPGLTEYHVWVPSTWSGIHANQWNFGGNAGTPQLPVGLIMRHVNCISADGKRRRNFPMSDPGPSGFPYIGYTFSFPNLDGSHTTWKIVGYNGERYQPRKYRQKKR